MRELCACEWEVRGENVSRDLAIYKVTEEKERSIRLSMRKETYIFEIQIAPRRGARDDAKAYLFPVPIFISIAKGVQKNHVKTRAERGSKRILAN